MDWLQHTRPPCPSPTPGVYSDSCPLSQWPHPTISSSVIPNSFHLWPFPASGSSNESVLHTMWPKYWSFSFIISPSSEYSGLISFQMDWLDLLDVQGTLKSLLQHHTVAYKCLSLNLNQKTSNFQGNGMRARMQIIYWCPKTLQDHLCRCNWRFLKIHHHLKPIVSTEATPVQLNTALCGERSCIILLTFVFKKKVRSITLFYYDLNYSTKGKVAYTLFLNTFSSGVKENFSLIT